MKNAKFAKNPPAPRKRVLILVLSLILLLLVGVGITLAYFSQSSGPVINTFQSGSVGAEIIESFSGNTKNAITVKNTGESPVYVRVRLVSYFEDSEGNVLPKASVSVSFTHGSDWVPIGDYYYYTKPLAGGAETTDLLSSAVTMAPGQVIEVLADTVQASPEQAVVDVWGVNSSNFIE